MFSALKKFHFHNTHYINESKMKSMGTEYILFALLKFTLLFHKFNVLIQTPILQIYKK